MRKIPMDVLVEALRNYGGHNSDCPNQEDDNCGCGWGHILKLMDEESEQAYAERAARYEAAKCLGISFWSVEVHDIRDQRLMVTEAAPR